MAKGKSPECPKCLPGWLVQFGDLMSLLLCFFILLLSMATMDSRKVEEYFEIMRKSMGFLEGSEDATSAQKQVLSKERVDASESSSQNDESDNSEVTSEMADIAQEYNDGNLETSEEVIVTVKNNNEFIMDIPSALMFSDGEYKINNDQAKRFIRKIARIIRTLSDNLDIEVIGHASSVEVFQSNIPNNSWDLSALRSIAIIQELMKNKIEPERLKVSAFGSYRPKGESYEENRRVELRFFSNKNDGEIESSNFFDRVSN